MKNELFQDLATSHQSNNNNFFDWEVEKELNRIENMSFMNKSIRGNQYNHKDFFIKDDINLEEYDQIFMLGETGETKYKKESKGDIEKKNPQTARNKETKVKVDIDEINKFYKDYEREIEKEINKELEKEFKPMDFIPESDKEKASRLITKFEFLRNGIEEKLISYEDVVYFVDYYELLSLLESKKVQTVDTLQKISDLYSEDETWGKLQAQLERTLNQTNMILENKLDMKKLLYEYSKNVEENKETQIVNKMSNIVDHKLKAKISKTVMSTDSYLNNSLKQKNKSKINNLEHIDKEGIFTTKGYTGNKLISHRGPRGGSVLKTTFNSKFENLEKNANNTNNLRDSHSSIKTSSVVSGVSLTSRNNNEFNTSRSNKRVELFDDKNKMANLYKFRKDRREILKATIGGKLNTRPDLFKFDVNTQLKEMNNDNRFKELLQMPKKLLDHIDETQQAPGNNINNIDSPSKGSTKNTIRKRIEDAVNFSKSKN